MARLEFESPTTVMLPSREPPPEVWTPWQRVLVVCVVTLTVIAVGFALYFLQTLLVPFLLALFLSFCLLPIVDWQVRFLRAPRWLAVLGAGMVGLVVLLAIGFFVVTSINRVTQNFDAYQQRWNQLTDRVLQMEVVERLGVGRTRETGLLFDTPEAASRQLLILVLNGLTYLVSNSTLVLVFMIFIFVGRTPAPTIKGGLLVDIQTRITRYLMRLVFISLLTGLLVGATLYFLNVEFAFLFGFLAFALNFIPTIGSMIATVLPLPVVLVSDDLTLTAKVLAIVIPGVIQFLLGNIVHPKIQGTALALHPVTMLASLIFFGMIWGVVGAFLAMPIAGVVKIILDRFPSTRPIAALLEGDLQTVAQALSPSSG